MDLTSKTQRVVLCALDPAEDAAVRVRRFHNAMVRTKVHEKCTSFIIILPTEVKTIARVQGDLKRLNIAEDPEGVLGRVFARTVGDVGARNAGNT